MIGWRDKVEIGNWKASPGTLQIACKSDAGVGCDPFTGPTAQVVPVDEKSVVDPELKCS